MILTQEIRIKATSSQTVLSLNMRNIEDLFPGFMLGDFAVMHGLPYVLPLSLLLAVRAQLPYQLGGLESNAIFVDGGNTFRLYNTSRLARLHGMKPVEVLKRIFISRAFTAHQMTFIILDRVEEIAKKHNAKLVIISDLAELYLDEDIPTEESRETFSHVTSHLAKFAEESRMVVLAVCPLHEHSRRSAFFHAVACAKSNVNIRLRKKSTYPFDKQFVLEKHGVFKLGCVDFPSENLTLKDFVEAQLSNGKNS